ncbi:class I SAM-dependent methyltransferase [Jannaschia seohaensis]|uniref:Methyltransferase domain-containing protein n=1 Tax=Jannaschia seohaensis TaxID=475081 RepID=A0A2Y9AW13_9RHOB|nr:class I SAM-dependent methyltransferase [Jannaschia seohaensis]PWJ17467.1 methyltransferase family protein [Jannaschia seohaensis]SSA47538.1 Methyltransferase domain-containing protein [Jannaschia seohaensis]
MTYHAFKTAEKDGWGARASGYNASTGLVTTGAIPTLLAMAEAVPGRRVLDLCCGTGRAAGAAAALGAEAEGIDISEGMVTTAQAAFPGVPFAVGDAEAIPRPGGAYDAVICSFGVMHASDPAAMFAEMARVLRPGGRVALSHWVGPPASPLFRIVFGTMREHADMSLVPPSPPPFALSSVEAMGDALEAAGFESVMAAELPLVFEAPEGAFAARFRQFAVRAAVILDAQPKPVLDEIETAWEAQMAAFLSDGVYRIPMPALAFSATRRG